MIHLADSDIAEFRALFREETGREITVEQARTYAENLVRLVGFVMKPRSPAVEN